MDFSESDGRPECTIQLDVGDVFSWIVKFRKTGVIVNNRLFNATYFCYQQTHFSLPLYMSNADSSEIDILTS